MEKKGLLDRALGWRYFGCLGIAAFVVAMVCLWPNASVKGIQAYAALLGLRPIASGLIQHRRGAERAHLSAKLSPVSVLLKLAIIPVVDVFAWNIISLAESLLHQRWKSNNCPSRAVRVCSVLSITANAFAVFGFGFIQLDSWFHVSLVSVASLLNHPLYLFSILSNR
jgi:hypothetical protein